MIFQLSIEYVFNITEGYWTLIAAEVDWSKITGNSTLYLVEYSPAAPLEFSYKCSRTLTFRNGSIYLELANIQVNFTFDFSESRKKFNYGQFDKFKKKKMTYLS